MTNSTLALVVSWALPVASAVALIFCGQWMWATALMAAFAVPHQLMGLTST
jgi:succinate dehydrogenase hydrophobic anchor subunit